MQRRLLCGSALTLGALMVCSAVSGSTIYGLNMRGDNSFFSTTTTDFVGSYGVIGGIQTWDSFAMDMDPTATTLWAVTWETDNAFGTIDPTTGEFTTVGNISGIDPAANVSGMSVNPVTGDWYMTAIEGGASYLYKGDISTGIFGLVGAMGFDLNIDLAIDSQGNAYGHDIGTDELLSIDLATGVTTAIGSTGIDANYAQGMDFDYATDTLYATMYTGGGTGVFASFDLATGLATILQDTTGLDAEMEMVVASAIPAPGALTLLGLGLVLGRRRRA